MFPLFMILVVGFFMGITGLGGFLYPPLVISLLHVSIREAMVISLGSFIIISIITAWIYHKNGLLNLQYGYLLLMGLVPGVFLGTSANVNLPDLLLYFVLSLFLFLMAVILLRREIKGYDKEEKVAPAIIFPHRLFLLLVGFLSGFMSGFLGVGGPIITVPLMTAMGFKPKIAVGSSLFAMIFSVSLAFSFHLFYTNVSMGSVVLIGGLGSIGSTISALFVRRINQRVIRLLIILLAFFSSLYLLQRVFS